MKRLAILGSTGSIGTQALDVVRKHPDRFDVVALTAGSNAELLAAQVDEFRPDLAVLASEEGSPAAFASGRRALLDAARHPDADVVLNALVGSVGLAPTLAALEAGKTVALANKESLVVGGELVMGLVAGAPERLLPVDSEHSGVFQCLAGNRIGDVARVILTASGGPFRGKSLAEMRSVSVDDALAHPTWKMGRKITVDSATLMNKGFEAIEAHHLFGIPMDRVELVVHPQSIVHGMVEFVDGSCLLQASAPDMRLAIQIALAWPERLAGGAEPLRWPDVGTLQFEPLDSSRFRCARLALEAGGRGSTYPCVLNAANEEAVEAFLAGRLDFLGIGRVVEEVLERHDGAARVSTDALEAAESWARREASSLIAASDARARR